MISFIQKLSQNIFSVKISKIALSGVMIVFRWSSYLPTTTDNNRHTIDNKARTCFNEYFLIKRDFYTILPLSMMKCLYKKLIYREKN